MVKRKYAFIGEIKANRRIISIGSNGIRIVYTVQCLKCNDIHTVNPMDFGHAHRCDNETDICIFFGIKRTTFIERKKAGMSIRQALGLEPVIRIENFNIEDNRYIKEMNKLINNKTKL